ncbi:MAG TPA: acetoacetate decarboxylase family protein [Allosphingosinicella sp.]|nr:acetoacetate decarboxylase family protein [Allosphingosinicella sp.]
MGPPKRQKRLAGRHAYVDGIRYVMPVDASEASAVVAAFPCDYQAARKLFPAGDVHPFRLWNKALLVLTVIDYRKTDIGSYIEYSLAIACTKGPRPAPRLLGGLLIDRYGTGQYVVDLPVSSEVSVKGGKGIWGMPKHQAALDYREGRKWVSAQYDLDGQMVTRLDVRRPAKAWFPVNMGAANYCSFRGMIYRSFIYFRGKAGLQLFKKGGARLVLGDSPRADWLRGLDFAEDALFAAYLPAVKGVLDDYFDCWFVTPPTRPEAPIGEGLETTYPLGYSEEWPPPPTRDSSFNLDED